MTDTEQTVYASDPTAPTAATGLYFIAGYLFGDPGGYTGQPIIIIAKSDVVSFAGKKPTKGKNRLCQRFADSAVAVGGRVVGWDNPSVGKDRVKVTGIALTLETTVMPRMLNGANAAQVRAWGAAVIETEGSKDGKIVDDPDIGHATAASNAFALPGADVLTWVKDGAQMGSCWLSDDAQVERLATFPFVQTGRVPTHTSNPAPIAPPPPPPKTKEPISALVPRTGEPILPGGHTITHVSMDALSVGSSSWDMSALKAAISASKNSGATACCLSIDGGSEDSQAAKNFYGVVTLNDPQGTRPPHTVVKFWTGDYQARITSLLAQVADVVEDDPFVREVMMSWNGAEFSVEWTIREMSTQQNRDAWKAAGYDVNADMANIADAASMFDHAGFLSTKMAAFNSMFFQHLYANGTMRQDQAFTRTVLERWAALLGPARLVLGVNNADLASYGPARPAIYSLMLEYAQQGYERHDQTVTAVKMGGAAGCQKFFAKPNLDLMIADLVFTQEPPRGWGLSTAQVQFAQGYLMAAAKKDGRTL